MIPTMQWIQCNQLYVIASGNSHYEGRVKPRSRHLLFSADGSSDASARLSCGQRMGSSWEMCSHMLSGQTHTHTHISVMKCVQIVIAVIRGCFPRGGLQKQVTCNQAEKLPEKDRHQTHSVHLLSGARDAFEDHKLCASDISCILYIDFVMHS